MVSAREADTARQPDAVPQHQRAHSLSRDPGHRGRGYGNAFSIIYFTCLLSCLGFAVTKVVGTRPTRFSDETARRFPDLYAEEIRNYVLALENA